MHPNMDTHRKTYVANYCLLPKLIHKKTRFVSIQTPVIYFDVHLFYYSFQH